MSKPKKNRKQKKARNLETLHMILHCKGGFMKDRRDRRAKEKKSSWKHETDDLS